MARVWMEGFEDGFPHGYYTESGLFNNYINGFSMNLFPCDPSYNDTMYTLETGRSVISQKCLAIQTTSVLHNIIKTLDTSLDECYFRVYFKHERDLDSSLADLGSVIKLVNPSGDTIFTFFDVAIATQWDLYIITGGLLQKVAEVTLTASTWYKLDVYVKIGNGTGAYEIKIDDVSIASNTSDNTGTNNVSSIFFGHTLLASEGKLYFDDIALNDTSGTVNNSWCGSGSICALKPKAAGNKSQFDTSQGYATAEASTNTTTVNITGHGLATNDVMYNSTRDAYRIITRVNDDQFTVSAITDQAENDIIILFLYNATITAAASTTTSIQVLPGNTLNCYDVTVNTSRSNAIRRVCTVVGVYVYNYWRDNDAYEGSIVTSQVAGDSIKTFKVHPYAITDHYLCVSNDAPNPEYSHIQSPTSNDIDLFDMQELVADLGFESNAVIVAASNNIYAREMGAGSVMKSVLRINGTDYVSDDITLKGGTLEYQTVYNISPDTSAQFVLSEIDAIECGVKVV